MIGLQRHQSSILDRAAYRKVIERLKGVTFDPQDLMDRVVEKTADSRGSHPGSFSFQV
jgi:hypothetical protein